MSSSSKEKDEKQIVKISYDEFYQKYLTKDTTANILSEYMALIQLHRGNKFSKKTMLSDESYETSVANEPNFWRSTCHCPISNQSVESEVFMDAYSHEWSTLYGQYGVDFCFYNKKVYFRVKKMAQHAAMIHAYYSVIVSDIQDVHLLHEEEANSHQLKLTPKIPEKKIEKKQTIVVPQDQGNETTSEGAEQKKLLQITYEDFYNRCVIEESTDNAIGEYMSLIQLHKGNAFSKKKMLKDQSHETSVGYEPTFWRSTCHCPISHRSVESEILTRNNRVSTSYGQNGVDFRFFQGQVYFRVKKMAQRAAMIHAYYSVVVTDNNPEHLLKEMTHEVNSNPQEASSDNLDTSKEEVKEEDADKKLIQNDSFCTVSIPDDIRLLFNQGVRNDSIQSIEFHVVEPKNKDEYIKIASTPISKDIPTLMVCDIELKNPKLKATSQRPHKSKSKAFKDTVSILIPQLLECKTLRYQDNEEMELVALYQRYHDAEIFYKSFPPPCTIQNIFEANSDKHRFHLYTYEVPMLESLGLTCCGILFPYCEGIHTCKPLILHSKGMKASAQVYHVSMVELSNDEIEILIGFNCLLHDGTSYGRSKKCRKSELSRGLLQRLSKFTEQSKERMRTTMHERTHLFIPLDRKNNIDFDLIDNVMLNKLKSCRQWISFAMKGETRYVFDKKKPGELFIVLEDSLVLKDEKSVVLARRSISVKNDFSSLLGTRSNSASIQLNDIDVQVFPLPFKLMMAFHSLSLFYPQLERIFELRQLGLFLNIPPRGVEEATSTSPVAYERLEHLGDSVLFYYVAIKLFLGNSNMTHDEEDMADMKAEIVKNTVLAKAGFRCGINRLLQTNICTNYVLSYLGNENSPGGAEGKRSVNPSRLADVVESFLGTLFSESFSQSGEIITWFLNELELPIDSLGNDIDIDFYNPSYCVWQGQIESMKAMLTLSSHTHIYQHLCHCLETLQRFFRLPELTIEERIIFYSALYDDSLEWDMDDDLMENKRILLSRFRENLFFLGEASLHLLITYECFQRFPTLSAGDLHFLKACAMADDVIAYITIKNGIHKMLFDHDETEERLKLLQMIEQAEYKGLVDWCTKKKGGWVLGLEEFQRRSKSTYQRSPRYCGIGGGCLIGQKAKLGKQFTEDLVFSFKAIMGACVIAFGFKRMRNLFVPIFDELLLLTPDEIRRNYSTPLTRTNSSGKRDKSHRTMEALREKFGDGWSVFSVNDI